MNWKSGPKKVAIVLSGFPVVSETFIALQVAQLIKAGHVIEVFNFGEIGDNSLLPEGLEKFFPDESVHHVQRYLATGSVRRLASLFLTAPFPTLKLLIFNPFPEGRRQSIGRAYFLEKLKPFDIVHFQFVTVAGSCLRFKKLGFMRKQRNFVCSIRGFDVTAKKFDEIVDWRLVFKHVRVFTPVCDFLSEQLSKKRFFRRTASIRKVASPINVEKIGQQRGCDSNVLTFVSVGRLVEKKGFDIALAALSLLRHQGTTFRYTIIGDGPLYGELKEQVCRLGLEEEVIFTGSLPSAKTLETMAENAILLAPARTAENGDCEGIPNVLKEAMYMGLQVVTTAHAGIPELVRDEVNGYCAPEGDVEAYLEAINACVKNRRNWDTVRRSAMATVVEGYSPEATTDQLLAVFDSLEDLGAKIPQE